MWMMQISGRGHLPTEGKCPRFICHFCFSESGLLVILLEFEDVIGPLRSRKKLGNSCDDMTQNRLPPAR